MDFVDPSDDLSPEELEQLASLTDPDAEEDAEFKWDEEFQRYILAMLVSDKHFLVQSLPLVQARYFTDEVHKLLCKLLFDHFEKYKVLAKKAWIVQEVKDRIAEKNEDIQLHFLTELNKVYEYYTPGVESRDYLLDKIVHFAKMQAIKVSFNQCLNVIKKDPENDDTWMKIGDILREALLVDKNFDPGLDYFQSFEERYEKTEEDDSSEIFTAAWKSIDNALLAGGPTRGEVYAIIALSGVGKSLYLVTAALKNVMVLGKRVLYVSLEMDEEKIAERFDAQIAVVDINKLQENKDLVKQAFEEHLEDQEDPRTLIIKQFAPGVMDVNTLRAYLQQLSLVDFRPDMVIVDYIGEMKDYPGIPTWQSRYRIVRDLRRLAKEEDICILTAMQANKSAREAQEQTDRFGNLQTGVIDDDNLADAHGQVKPLDGWWSINQTQHEKNAGVARIFLGKARHGKSRITFWIEYNMQTLAMTEISQKKFSEKLRLEMNNAVTRMQDLPNQQNPSGKQGLKADQIVKKEATIEGEDGPEAQGE
jgi:KaiC/GvpD/RAD55 family RecA-like ATPase